MERLSSVAKLELEINQTSSPRNLSLTNIKKDSDCNLVIGHSDSNDLFVSHQHAF